MSQTMERAEGNLLMPNTSAATGAAVAQKLARVRRGARRKNRDGTYVPATMPTIKAKKMSTP